MNNLNERFLSDLDIKRSAGVELVSESEGIVLRDNLATSLSHQDSWAMNGGSERDSHGLLEAVQIN